MFVASDGNSSKPGRTGPVFRVPQSDQPALYLRSALPAHSAMFFRFARRTHHNCRLDICFSDEIIPPHAQEPRMPKDIRNVFVSHIHEDDAGLADLSDLLGRHGMEVRNYSITSDKENNAQSADYIKSEILAPRINACSTLVVYITPDTKNSDWGKLGN